MPDMPSFVPTPACENELADFRHVAWPQAQPRARAITHVPTEESEDRGDHRISRRPSRLTDRYW